jgi:plasmid stabilization system protein ParE
MKRVMHFLALASKDILEAEAYYGSISDRLGERFMNDLDRTIDLIQQHPNGFQIVAGSFRQAPLDHFPYVVIYQVFEKEIVVFRLFHTSQDPQKKFVG